MIHLQQTALYRLTLLELVHIHMLLHNALLVVQCPTHMHHTLQLTQAHKLTESLRMTLQQIENNQI